MMNMASLKIEYPGTLSDEETRFVFDSFRASYPDLTDEWIRIEQDPSSQDPDALRPISIAFKQFIRSFNNVESTMASSSLFMDMRKVIHTQIIKG